MAIIKTKTSRKFVRKGMKISVHLLTLVGDKFRLVLLFFVFYIKNLETDTVEQFLVENDAKNVHGQLLTHQILSK